MGNGNIKNTFLLLGIVTITTITLLAGSYGMLVVSEYGEDIQSVVAGTFNIEFKSGEYIALNNATPMTDDNGMNSESYDFTISNTGNVSANYLIRLEEDPTLEINKKLTAKEIKYSIKEEDGEWSKPKLLSTSPNYILVQDKNLKAENKVNYSLKMWIDEKVGNEGKNKIFKSKVVVEAVQDNLNFKKVIDDSPIINIKGLSSINIEEGEVYIDEGVEEIVDDKDEIDVSKVTTTYQFYNGEELEDVESIDTSKIGVYYVNYEVTDSSGNIGKNSRSVNVYKKGTIPPSIQLNGDANVYITKDELYEEKGVTSIGDAITIGEVNNKKDGEYTLRYITTDGINQASVTRNVIVSSTEVVTVSLIKSEEVNAIGSSDTLTCKKRVDEDSCDITLPTIEAKEGFAGYWSTSDKAIDGELPGATVSVTEDTKYYALASKKIKVTYSMENGVSEIGKETDSCIVRDEEKGCNIILPTIISRLGYDKKVWTTSKDAVEGVLPKKTVTVTENTTYYAKAIDETSPTCKIDSTSTNKVNTTGDLTLKLKCTDTSETIKKDLTSDDLTILVNKIEINPEVKEITNTTNIKNGKVYLVSLKRLSVPGTLSIRVKENAITDYSNNGNLKTIATAGVTVKNN